MEHGLCNGTVSVPISVCSSVSLFNLTAAAAYGGFAAVGPVGRRYRSIAARQAPQQHGPQHGAQQQMWVVPRLQLT